MPHFLDTKTTEAELARAFDAVHRALHATRCGSVGVRFPNANDATLGGVIRLFFFDEQAMPKLIKTLHDAGLPMTAIAESLQTTRFERVSRVQASSNVERLMRRAMCRHQVSAEEARQRYEGVAAHRLALPSIVVNSRSTKQRFRLFVLRQHADAEARGGFSTYGLSNIATVPVF